MRAKLTIQLCGEGEVYSGFDDQVYARRSRIPLTTVRQPCAEIGKVAIRTLVERILHRDLPPREILLSATLVKRASA